MLEKYALTTGQFTLNIETSERKCAVSYVCKTQQTHGVGILLKYLQSAYRGLFKPRHCCR